MIPPLICPDPGPDAEEGLKMGCVAVPDEYRIVEPVPAQEVFTSALGKAETANGHAWLTWITSRPAPGGMATDRVATLHQILPIEAIPAVISELQALLLTYERQHRKRMD
jgi:hypothetical protein